MKQKRGKILSNQASLDMFNEQYEVNFDYQKPDGYWICSHKEHVSVPVRHGANEKNNHNAAKNIIKQRYQKCRINSVTYC